MAVSIFHIGLPLDHPSIPVEERPKIVKRIRDLQERMVRAGYRYEIIQASPETGLDDFRQQLRTQPCDGVLIGGGVAGDPAMSYFMEQIIDVTHQVVPQAKIMFYNHSLDVREIVERWFGSPPCSPDAYVEVTEKETCDQEKPVRYDGSEPGKEATGAIGAAK